MGSGCGSGSCSSSSLPLPFPGFGETCSSTGEGVSDLGAMGGLKMEVRVGGKGFWGVSGDGCGVSTDRLVDAAVGARYDGVLGRAGSCALVANAGVMRWGSCSCPMG